MHFSEESLARIAEVQKQLDEFQAQKKIEAYDKEVRWAHYRDQLAKMPEWKPGSKKSRGAQQNLDNQLYN